MKPHCHSLSSWLWTVLLVFYLAINLAACSAPTLLIPEIVDPPTPTVTPKPAPMVGLSATPVKNSTLYVFAAASLTDAFTRIGKTFEASHPGVKVSFNFAGSQTLVQQINSAAPADVFASAAQKQMDTISQAGRIDRASVKIFALNKLVVVLPKANPGAIQSLQDLTKPGLKIVLADKSVPVGQYALDFLDKAVKDPTFSPDYKDGFIKNVVSYEDNVKSVLVKVILGEADAGVIYTTDVTPDASTRVVQLAIPDELNVIAVYPIAPLKDSPSPELAKAFVAEILSIEGQTILLADGFLLPIR